MCARCLQRGHLQAHCPVAGSRLGPPNPNVPGAGNVQSMSGDGRSETFIDITTRGRTLCAMLDSGSDRSLCPLRLCRNAKITKVQTELYAANGSPIPAVGTTRVLFEIKGTPAHADVFVTDAVDEFILGYDFLEANNCEWLFGQSRIIINGVNVPLHSRLSKCTVRRIYVREPVIIPADSRANVPVRMPYVNLSTTESEWVIDAKQVRPGLLAARTLLSNDDRYAAISVLNLSGVDQSLREGHALGLASSCIVCSPPEPVPANEIHQACNVDSGNNDSVAATCSNRNTAAGGDTGDVVTCATIHAASDEPPPAASDCGDDWRHVQPVIDIDRLPTTLTAEQREQVIALIKSNADIFSKHEFDVGCTDLLEACIITDLTQRPIAEPLRRHARVHLDVIDETIEKMKRAGIVEEANSPWSANLVIVSKTDDKGPPVTPRVTIDFRGLKFKLYNI